MEGVESVVENLVESVNELAHVEMLALPVDAVIKAGEKAIETIEKLAKTEIPSNEVIGHEISSAVRKGKGKAKEVFEAADELVVRASASSSAVPKALGGSSAPTTLEERQQKLKELRLKMVSHSASPSIRELVAHLLPFAFVSRSLLDRTPRPPPTARISFRSIRKTRPPLESSLTSRRRRSSPRT